jgi:hypothetical protein
MMCGGSGGYSGSVIASSSTGRSAESASSQARPTWSGESTRMPFGVPTVYTILGNKVAP